MIYTISLLLWKSNYTQAVDSTLKEKKWSHFDLKNWVTGATKIQPRILSNWRIFESNWLDIESLIDNSTLNIDLIWLKYYWVLKSDSTF